MAEFRLERFKYNWRGTWQTGVAYKRDDIVRVNGKSYVCVVTHVSSSVFRTDLNAILPGSIPPQPQPKWVVMTDGRSFEGNWTSGRNYNLGDIVKYQGSLWLCVVSHTATSFAFDFSNWTVFAQTYSFVGNWQNGASYAPGAIIKYNGIVYRCIEAHTSSGTLENNILAWEEYHAGIEVKNNWQSTTQYRKNDLVKYGASVFRCIETHTSNTTALDNTKFVIEIFGSQYDGDWNDTTYYNVGDIVRHKGFTYYAVNNNYDSRPYINTGSVDWILISRSYSFVGEWSKTAAYKTGDVVLRGGNLYTALRDIGGVDLPDGVGDIDGIQDGSTLDYLEADTWELTVPGKGWKGLWENNVEYRVGDVVYFKGSTFVCTFEHTASILNFPGDNGNIFNYWDLLIQAGRPAALQEKGDLLTYGLSRQIDDDGSTVFDESTLGDTRLAIGERDQVLSVSNDLEIYWRNIIDDAEAIYVATNGIDDDGRGTFEKPFKTIRYASEYVEDTFDPGTPVIIRVSTGKFEEICPIIVPAGCAVNGDELRSTTVIANSAFSSYQNDYQYVTAYLEYFETILLDIIVGDEIVPQEGNTVPQVKIEQIPLIDPLTGEQQVDQQGNPIFTPSDFPVSNLDGANAVVNLITDYKNYIEFRIDDGEINPTITGSNTLNPNEFISNAGLALQLNKNFLAADFTAFLRNTYPEITFDTVKIKNDVASLIRGIRRDLTYSGNYNIVNAASRYANAVTGSQFSSMFLMRDSTGLRDLTTEGLQGVLNPPGIFDLYQKPTGGACVSLDPGWGPNDTRTWITNRSPYIQGVTNIGVGCVGKKVDGSLHNGGNKSMVSNDFTQVLSDGIGVWVTNNARTELVSVFTYYCQIGYFAEDGGIIRATNGNNSYGRYGSIADGEDATEIPQEVTAFNRNQEAQIKEAFAGGSTDEIFIFEYSNCGEQYTQATATIIGAGANAAVEYSDFRDGALFEARLTNPKESGRKGGAGYLVRQGSAQETLDASSTIRLSSNDPTQFLSEIDGMRILITSGTGAGQYGYISGFSIGSRTVTVRQESTGNLGWDHIIPGTPIEPSLDLTTRYRIEPRIEVSHPGFTSASYDLISPNRTYVDAKYGEITQNFTGLSGISTGQWLDDNGDPVTVSDIISFTALQFSGSFAFNPFVPFTIEGRSSGARTTITAITANTGTIIEVNDSGNSSSFELDEEINIVFAGTGETFDDAPITAVFSVSLVGQSYVVTLTNPGAGYSVGDIITIPGSQLGGTSPANDLKITITDVTDDSTASIQTFTSSGTGRANRFVALANSQHARFSDNGIDWTESTLSFTGDFRKLAAGNGRFLALANNENRISLSLDGQIWSTVNLPQRESWRDIVYGGGRFVIVADNTNTILVSTTGSSFTSAVIPDTDDVGDSTISQWTHVAYGAGKYVAVSANDRATATSTNGTNWTRHDTALPELLLGNDWDIVALEYGNNRFIVLDSEGRTAYSFDGIVWYLGSRAPAPGTIIWTNLKYEQGIFLGIGLEGVNPTSTCATTEDGLLWTSRSLSSSQRWGALTLGRINGESRWILLASNATTGALNHVRTGARAKCRADVTTGVFQTIKIWDPGSGYTSNNLPVLTITDNQFTVEVDYESRISNGVLAQPDFINRGTGYRTTTSKITISGNGYADIVPDGNELVVSGVRSIPSPGVQIRIQGVENPFTEIEGDLRVFNGAIITDLGDDGSGNGTRLVKFVITPSLRTDYDVVHGTEISLREKYSQCRVTGHDFLDIGTGNFEQTNYPEIYAGGRFFTAAPENEVLEQNGGRVFYTSTDQDGNFRTGELFAVSQATGVVTISAQFFDLDGLTELALGGVRLGGSGTVVNEFSTDPTFAADSNNVIPTQRAIASFLASRLSVGGENLEVNRLQAGRVVLGGADTEIDNATGGYLIIPREVRIDGNYTYTNESGNTVTAPVGVTGTLVSQSLFLRRFDDTMQ